MCSWVPSKKDQKQYPHFDAPLSLSELERIANDRDGVAKNSFFPFLKYEDTHRPFRPYGKDLKVREIRYGGRRDAAIFSRYRYELSERYEGLLATLGISNNVLAYRSIPVAPGSLAGRSNIHHAKEAFDRIREFDNCCVVTLDISKYFETVDHSRIKEVWCKLLGVTSLPDDYFSVFRAMTNYAIVDSKEAYTALGFFGLRPSGVQGYLVSREDMPKQLCSPKAFRDKICGKAAGFHSLVKKNKEAYGIPQGAPLSDLLANAYLIDFDVAMNQHSRSLGGYYTRYSDDILFVVPIDTSKAHGLMKYVQSQIEAYGTQLRIKETKCAIDRFVHSSNGMVHEAVYPGGRSRNGLNYLGFRFDGRRVYLRDTTLSNFRRKIARAINAEARNLVLRFPGKDLPFLETHLNTDTIIEKFGRVRDFRGGVDKRSWTFWTYVDRANKVFGEEARIYRQVRGYRDDIRDLARKALTKKM